MNKEGKTTAKVNKLGISIIAIEFFLNFLPQIIALIALRANFFGFTISDHIGLYNFTLVAIDVFFSNYLYCKTLKLIKSKDPTTELVKSKY
uniref:Uncharacterized protein n=1 Tax=Ditylenchus dipsaci TaxID=166011 RepID=A0A915ETR8_9BILA